MAVDIRQSTADPIAVDTGNVGIQGRVVSKTVQFTMFTLNENAVWGGRQHLLKSSYPFGILQIVTNRHAFRYEVGDCFKYSYSKHGVSNAVFRVLQKEEQELESENIVISAIEDFYFISRSVSEYTNPINNIIQRPDYTLTPFVKQLAMEVPYAMTDNTDIEVLLLAQRAGQLDLGFDSYISIDNGASYLLLANNVTNLTPAGQVVISAYPKDTYTIDTEIGFTIEFGNSADASLVGTTTWPNTFAGIGNVALLGNEIIFFKTITPVSGLRYRIENVIRARMDTEKADHVIGTNFYILSSDLVFLSHNEILAGINRDFKLVPYNIRKRGDISLALPIDFNVEGRWRKPYKPVNFIANGESLFGRYDDDIVLGWTPRFRGEGAGMGIPGIVLAETEWEGLFEIEVWVGGSKKRTQSGINNTTWTYTSAMNIADNTALADEVLFKLKNYRVESGMSYSSGFVNVSCKKNP